MMMRNALLCAVLTLGLGVAACGKKEEPSAVENATDTAKDALDMREHEKAKDAAENVKEAAEDAKDAVKEETSH